MLLLPAWPTDREYRPCPAHGFGCAMGGSASLCPAEGPGPEETSMAEVTGFAGLKLRQRPPGSARILHPQLSPFLAEYRARGEAALAEPFRGITADGTVVPDLFALEKTGVSTRPIREAAEAFLAALGPEQHQTALFSVDSDAWRRWSNIHPWIMRHGVCLADLTPAQRQRALALLETSLSASGFRTARDVMRLNDLV